VRGSFAKQGVMQFICAEMDSISDGKGTISVPFRPVQIQQHSYFHGGILRTIADSAGGYAAFSLTPEGSTVLVTEFKFNFLRPAEGERALAEARVIKAERSLTVSCMEVYVERGPGRVHVATGLKTCICVP
jgi:uncharacterized protein (TIGR00369 family)